MHDSELLLSSVAVTVTAVTPSENVCPEAGLYATSTGPPPLSSTSVGGGSVMLIDVCPGERYSVWFAGHINKGGVLSGTVIENKGGC